MIRGPLAAGELDGIKVDFSATESSGGSEAAVVQPLTYDRWSPLTPLRLSKSAPRPAPGEGRKEWARREGVGCVARTRM